VTIRSLIQEYKDTTTFRKKYGAGKWVNLPSLKGDPKTAKELYKLVHNAYKKIGGHLKVKSPMDLMGGKITVISAIDLDTDTEPDAVKLGKRKTGGIKSIGMGHDGSSAAKKAVVAKSAQDLKTRGFYAEMSDAIAHIMLTKHHIKSVNSEKTVRKILKGKDIEWVGAHPTGKYPKHPGWYYRVIGGSRHLKIMLGMPTV
jgi:hypothetical protein